MPLRYYLDTHIAGAVAIQLRTHGIDVVRCEEVGLAGTGDSQHLECATRQDRAVVTHDEDFLRLHFEWQTQGKEHAGIMFVHPRLQGRKNIGKVVKELAEYHDLIEGGAGTVEADIRNQVRYIT